MSHGTANGVALIAIAGLVASPSTADRDLFALLVVDGLIADFLAAIPHDVLDCLVAGRALLLSLAKFAARSASGSWTAVDRKSVV